jgi:hypothetical protein
MQKSAFGVLSHFRSTRKQPASRLLSIVASVDLFCHETSSKIIAVENAKRNFTEERRILPLQMVW